MPNLFTPREIIDSLLESIRQERKVRDESAARVSLANDRIKKATFLVRKMAGIWGIKLPDEGTIVKTPTTSKPEGVLVLDEAGNDVPQPWPIEPSKPYRRKYDCLCGRKFSKGNGLAIHLKYAKGGTHGKAVNE